MPVPGWLKWVGREVLFPLLKDELHIVVEKAVKQHGPGLPVALDSPGVLLHEEKK